MSESRGQRSIFPNEGGRDGSLFAHAGLQIARDLGHRYTSVKRSRIDSGSFPQSDVFPTSGIVQPGVFHSPITSTVAASLPTQSESTFSSESMFSSCRFCVFHR